MNQIVGKLRSAGEDFEFYPTTQEIVDRLAEKIFKRSEWREEYACEFRSVLDIGCGDGAFFRKLDATAAQQFNAAHGMSMMLPDRYGIEKSIALCELLSDDVVVIGSDFNEQTLIDKKVDLIFCNPPYSDFASWAEKIILTGNCKAVALVIPCRWKTDGRISGALRKRNMAAEVLGTFDFLSAERRARAKVDLLYISSARKEWDGMIYEEKIADPFDVWFDETFRISAEKERVQDFDHKEQRRQELVERGDTAEMLVQFYEADMEKLYANYRQLEKLDADIFEELKVNVENLKEGMRKRISGLKHLYWHELFRKYDRVTSRLTSSGRNRVIERLNGNTAIDFTLNNIFQLTMWLIRHSNTMFDEQLSDFFLSLCNPETIHRYKSNLRWNDDDWRYIKDGFKGWRNDVERHRTTMRNIRLDYRIVVQAHSNFDCSWSRVSMSGDCRDFLEDIYVIAGNLGFDVVRVLPSSLYDIDIDGWRNFDVLRTDGTPFANIKLYKNGNRHVRFCKDFMQKLNVEMARINGWVQDKSQAAEEMGMTAAEVERAWGCNSRLELTAGKQLLGLPA